MPPRPHLSPATAVPKEPAPTRRRGGSPGTEGAPAGEIAGRIGQAVESLDLVPLLARAVTRAGVEAPILTALAGLISGELPLEEWIGRVRTTTPPPARFAPTSWWQRRYRRMRLWWVASRARRAR